VLYVILALYFDKVIPSEYGRTLPWYFPFTKQFWKGHADHDTELDERTANIIREEDEQRQRTFRST
jgi:hypothetical protein